MPDVAISWYCGYHSSYVVKIRNVVPGDCHVAALGRLLAMTDLYVFLMNVTVQVSLRFRAVVVAGPYNETINRTTISNFVVPKKFKNWGQTSEEKCDILLKVISAPLKNYPFAILAYL